MERSNRSKRPADLDAVEAYAATNDLSQSGLQAALDRA